MIKDKLSFDSTKREIELLIENINAHLNKDIDMYFICIKDAIKKKEKK